MKKLFVTTIVLLCSLTTFGQNKSAKATIEVDGVCGMCKARIEKAAITTKGVKTASWDIASHELNLVYNETKTDLKTIQQNIANVGHDTPLYKASDEAYESIDMCCKYRDEQVVKDHQKDGGR
jgi:cation transport ATPase